MAQEQVAPSADTPIATTVAPEAAPASTEAQAASPGATEQAPDSQQGWEAEKAGILGKLEKAENDLKSQRGRTLKQDESNAILSGLSARAEASEQATMALARAIGSGQTEDLPQELEKIQSASAAQRRQVGFINQYQAVTEELMGIEGVGDGGPSEFAQVREAWNGIAEKANSSDSNAGDLMAEAYKGLTDAYRIRGQLDKAAHEKAMASSIATAKAEALEDAGLYNTDVGAAPAGAGALTYAQGAAAYNRGEITDEQFMKIRNKR
jgi:hypothetical protein